MSTLKKENTKYRVQFSIYLIFSGDMDKRRDPKYKQISGHIPVELYKQFKTACFTRDIKQSDAIEKAVELWVSAEQEK